jgi:hypothetical protein
MGGHGGSRSKGGAGGVNSKRWTSGVRQTPPKPPAASISSKSADLAQLLKLRSRVISNKQQGVFGNKQETSAAIAEFNSARESFEKKHGSVKSLSKDELKAAKREGLKLHQRETRQKYKETRQRMAKS